MPTSRIIERRLDGAHALGIAVVASLMLGVLLRAYVFWALVFLVIPTGCVVILPAFRVARERILHERRLLQA